MKFLLTVALLIGAMTAFAQNPIDGQWKGIRESPNGSFEVNYTLKVEGNVLTGTSKSQFGELKIENGKVDGKKFSYRISVNDMIIENTGELISQDEILVKSDRGDMKLTRVK